MSEDRYLSNLGLGCAFLFVRRGGAEKCFVWSSHSYSHTGNKDGQLRERNIMEALELSFSSLFLVFNNELVPSGRHVVSCPETKGRQSAN
jgi:hypothetical protein